MLPSDLAGVTPATYEERSNLEAALGAACTRIRTAIENQGIRPRLAHPDTKGSEISKLNEILSEQKASFTELFRRLTMGTDHTTTEVTTNNVDFLAGAWVSTESGSCYYCQVKQGIPRIVYCYGGNQEATGEYYALKRIGDEIVGRFRWFDGGAAGFAWLKIDSPTLLSGAWWYGADVPEKAYNDPELLKRSKGMNSYVWRKQADVTFPGWALQAFDQLP